MSEPYQIVIGLEVHVQLLTRSKLFCGCDTRFGAPPNTQTCPVCIGMPGSLPVMNRAAFELALKSAVALNCVIGRQTKWDRKNYYYPDLPKGYQISQYDLPIGRDGWLELTDADGQATARRIGIIRVHLEEDVGKSMHDQPSGVGASRIDLNRAGTPLLEIVSRPDIRSPAEAKTFLSELKLLLNYLGVSDCNMQEGSLRVDANINLHIDTPQSTVATPIVEVKNMNSFRAVERAMAYEAQRQYQQWQRTGKRLGEAAKSTRGWDDSAGVTREQRTKEESSDYRYFPEPDLPPVIVSEAEIEAARASLGELPAAIRKRLQLQYGITPYDSEVIVSAGRAVVDYYEATVRTCGDGKTAANWVQQDVLRTLNQQQIEIQQFPVPPEALGRLILKVLGGELTTARARDVLAEMVTSGRSLEESLARLGVSSVDENELLELCRRLVTANPKIVAEARQGKLKGIAQLVGQAKQVNPNVNPKRVQEVCLQLIQQPQAST